MFINSKEESVKATISLPKGYQYTGDLQEGLLHGHGTCISKNGTNYTREVRDEERSVRWTTIPGDVGTYMMVNTSMIASMAQGLMHMQIDNDTRASLSTFYT